MDDLVRANTGVAGFFDDRFDDVFVGSVEVQYTLRIRLEIGLLAEAHNHKAVTLNNILRWNVRVVESRNFVDITTRRSDIDRPAANRNPRFARGIITRWAPMKRGKRMK